VSQYTPRAIATTAITTIPQNVHVIEPPDCNDGTRRLSFLSRLKRPPLIPHLSIIDPYPADIRDPVLQVLREVEITAASVRLSDQNVQPQVNVNKRPA
jgi:hypothetical protein